MAADGNAPGASVYDLTMGAGTSTARALVLEAPEKLLGAELPVPSIGDDDAVLLVEACGLCGTDHEQFTGALPTPGRFVPGHEVVGVIGDIGHGAARRWHLRKGDRVAVEVFQSCRACDACLSGDYRHCSVHGMADMYGFIALDRPPGLWGGYASHLYLSSDAMVLPVPASMDAAVATLFNPVGAGIRWGVTVPGTKAGDVVAVLGPGIRGLSVAAAAKDAGAGHVMVTGKGPNDTGRRADPLRRHSGRHRGRRDRSGSRGVGPGRLPGPAGWNRRPGRDQRIHRDTRLPSRSRRLQGAAPPRSAGSRHVR